MPDPDLALGNGVASSRRDGRSRRAEGWLFGTKHFRFKLLSGTVSAVIVIALLTGVFSWATWRNHTRVEAQRHDIAVTHLSSEIENGLAELETYHRGALLFGSGDSGTKFQSQLDAVKTGFDRLSTLLPDQDSIDHARDQVGQWAAKVSPAFVPAGTKTKRIPGDLDYTSLNQARAILDSVQDEAQIAVNARESDAERAARASELLDTLPRLERALLEMRNEARAFLLTSDSRNLDTYRRAIIDFNTYHGSLALMVTSSPREAAMLADVRASVERWINSAAAPVLDAKRNNRPLPPLATILKNDEALTDVLVTLAKFERDETINFELHRAAARREFLLKTGLFALVAAGAVLLLLSSNIYSFILVRRQIAKLQGAEGRIRSIIDSTLDGMLTLDGSGTITLMNPAAERMFGCRNKEMVGHKFGRLVPEGYFGNSETAEPLVWDELAARTGTTSLAVGCTRHRTVFPVEISLSQMAVEEKPTYVAMIRDVTERKRFEHQLAAEKESLAVTLRSIGDGVVTTDVQGNIIMINNAAEILTGWQNRDAIGQPLQAVFNIQIDLAAQARAQRNGYHTAAQSILSSIPENATLLSRDGTERLVEQVASPIRDNKNEVAGVVLVFRDITERERNEGERRKAEALEQLGLLAGGIAHDFNNLLTAIMGNISLATLMLPPASEMTSRLNDAKNASIRARDLAQQLLTFARGGAPIKKTASIGKLIQDTVGFSLRGSHSRGEFKLEPDLWPAEIDLGQISQVIANLVVNADQAMPNGGTLRVACDNFRYGEGASQIIPDLWPADYVRIAIKDEGVGIPENYLKRIFDPYFTTKPKGNGLGLATTYSIIKNHKGLITVESEVNMGTTFTIYLPAAAKRVAKPQETQQPVDLPLNGSGRILVVDDEEAIRALVEFTLEHLGYEVYGAETALEGVNLYRQKMEAGERFDLVILDLTLPGGMGGKEALKHLFEIDRNVNAIVSSGYATDATMSRFGDFGFRGVIAKPYEASELGRIVKEVITAAPAANGNGARPAEAVAL